MGIQCGPKPVQGHEEEESTPPTQGELKLAGPCAGLGCSHLHTLVLQL